MTETRRLRALIEQWLAKADKDWHQGHDDVEDGVWSYQHEANGRAKARREDAAELSALLSEPQAAHEAMHASAPTGYKCGDCTIDNEPCPTCYESAWRKRHPNVIRILPTGEPQAAQELNMNEPEAPSPSETDATKWAASFVAHNQWKPEIAADEGAMTAWFATAIMAGWDESARRMEKQVREFIGWLSADIPELHQVEVPRLADSYRRFQIMRDPDCPEARALVAAAPPVLSAPPEADKGWTPFAPAETDRSTTNSGDVGGFRNDR